MVCSCWYLFVISICEGDWGKTRHDARSSSNVNRSCLFYCSLERSVTQQRRWRVWGAVSVASVAVADMESRGLPKRWYSLHIWCLLVSTVVSGVNCLNIVFSSVPGFVCSLHPALNLCSQTGKLIDFSRQHQLRLSNLYNYSTKTVSWPKKSPLHFL